MSAAALSLALHVTEARSCNTHQGSTAHLQLLWLPSTSHTLGALALTRQLQYQLACITLHVDSLISQVLMSVHTLIYTADG